MTVTIRPIRPSDYRPVIAVVNDWWNGRHMADKLPRLFFEHFTAATRKLTMMALLCRLTPWDEEKSRPVRANCHDLGQSSRPPRSTVGRKRISTPPPHVLQPTAT